MNIIKLFEDAVKEDDPEKLDQFLLLLMDKWVFFFLQESYGVNTPISSGDVVPVLTTSKQYPINLLTINNELGNNGVIYTSCDLAVSLSEVDCKVGKMKGLKAFKMFINTSDIDAVYVQADTCHVHIPKNEIRRLVASKI